MDLTKYTELKSAIDKSSKVVRWYPHSDFGGTATVKGPWNRWIRIIGGNEPCAKKAGIADAYEDAKFIAEAMNNVASLLHDLEALNNENERLKTELELSEEERYFEQIAKDREY